MSPNLPAMQISIVLSWAFELCFIVAILALFGSLANVEKNKQEHLLLQSTNELMAANYRDIHADKVDYAKKLHDFNHHLGVIRGLTSTGTQEEIKEYVDSLLATSYKEIAMCHSGNDIVDAVINCKAAEAKDSEITFTWKADFSAPADIDPIDICAILANQIDNAFDACKLIEDSGKRRVDVRIWQKTGNMAFFQVTNTTAANPFTETGELHSTKTDKSRPHGLGIRNIRETAEKYSGTLRNTYQNGQFTSTVLLCYKQRKA